MGFITPIVVGLSGFILLATALLTDADGKTKFYSLVGAFVILVLLAAVFVTLGMAIQFLAAFKSFGDTLMRRRFSLFMAWTLLRSHKRRDSLALRLQARMDGLRSRPTRAKLSDLIAATLALLVLSLTMRTGLYNDLVDHISSEFAVALQVVMMALAAVFAGRIVPRTVMALVALASLATSVALVIALAVSTPAITLGLPPIAENVLTAVVALVLLVAGIFALRLATPPLFVWLDKKGVLGLAHALARTYKTRLTLQPFVSIVGVSLGIWALIVVLSVMRGFADDLQTKILRTNAHITVEPRDASGVLGDPYLLTDAITAVGGVREVQAMAYGEVMMSSSTSVAVNVVLKGMTDEDLRNSEQLEGTVAPGDVRWLWRPESLLSDRHRYPLAVSTGKASFRPDLDDTSTAAGGDDDPLGDGTPNLIQDLGAGDPFGAASNDPAVFPGILLGAELSKSLNVTVGSEINVISPDGDFGPTGVRPKLKAFRVAGIFTTGMYEYDQKLAYMALDDAQRFLNLERHLNRLEIRVDEPGGTGDIIAKLEPILAQSGQDLRSMGWRERNKSLFAALALERIAMFIILGLTIIVAALSILSALTMIVVQRSKDISVLKALGASNGDITRTFMGIGGVIGIIATATGLAIGLGFTSAVKAFGVPLPKEYYITTLPIQVDYLEVVVVALIAMAICMAATWYPARTASRLSPVEGFRHG